MTDQLPDDALYKRAESMYYTGSYTAIDYIFDALKVHRDGLLLLMDLDHGVGCDMWGDLVQSTGMPCSCGLDQHIASLKQLLGVSQ